MLLLIRAMGFITPYSLGFSLDIALIYIKAWKTQKLKEVRPAIHPVNDDGDKREVKSQIHSITNSLREDGNINSELSLPSVCCRCSKDLESEKGPTMPRQ